MFAHEFGDAVHLDLGGEHGQQAGRSVARVREPASMVLQQLEEGAPLPFDLLRKAVCRADYLPATDEPAVYGPNATIGAQVGA